ncbi:TetR/AcrR family transcriptional regulator [Nocardia sp. NBC_01377]|uniref:TetR/AcrR family transcriptional regulator n=1 Tax=Nocardia sp. NBC_01377 TaxID=2903595 RepID=UPI0032474840
MAGRNTANSSSEKPLPEWQLARRGQIIDAAIDLLGERPYENIQIRDVAQRAGVALGTLYRYFESKEHLYAITLLEWVRPVREPARHPAAGAAARLRSKLHMMVAANKKYPHFLAMQHTLHASTNPVVQKLLATYQQSGFEWFNSELSLLGEDRAHDLGLMLWAINNTIYTRIRLSAGTYEDARRVGDKFIDLIAAELGAAELASRGDGQPSPNADVDN